MLSVCLRGQNGVPDDGQKVSPKHVELIIKNKVEKECILFASVILMLNLVCC